MQVAAITLTPTLLRYGLCAGVKKKHHTDWWTIGQKQRTCSIAEQLVPCVFMCHIDVVANDTNMKKRKVQQSSEVFFSFFTSYVILNGNYWFIQKISFRTHSCSIHIQFHCHFVSMWFMRLETKWNCQSPSRMVECFASREYSKEKKSRFSVRCSFVLTSFRTQYLLNYALQLQ